MLKSMTGFGDFALNDGSTSVGVEVRSVNHKYLKVVGRLPETHSALESQIEGVVRGRVRRGTVTVAVRLHRRNEGTPATINTDAALAYLKQLRGLGVDVSHALPAVLQLPGVIEETGVVVDPASEWPVVEKALAEAIERLERMRLEEGAAMQRELDGHCDDVAARVDAIAERSPQIVKGYRDRIAERVGELLADHNVKITTSDLLREVSIFADRCDIAEEIARLRSHLVQFRETVASEEGAGRKLDFLGQEMFRETNTIGSKANDAPTAKLVVELKSTIERMREIIANIE